MNRWKFWIIAAVLFISGGLLGSAGTALYIRHTIREIVTGNPDVMYGAIMRQLTRKLDLSGEQEARIGEIVKAGQARMQQLRREFTPRAVGIIRSYGDEVRTVLSPEQAEKFEKLRAQTRKNWPILGSIEKDRSP